MLEIVVDIYVDLPNEPATITAWNGHDEVVLTDHEWSEMDKNLRGKEYRADYHLTTKGKDRVDRTILTFPQVVMDLK